MSFLLTEKIKSLTYSLSIKSYFADGFMCVTFDSKMKSIDKDHIHM
jgi:hypothetical protein